MTSNNITTKTSGKESSEHQNTIGHYVLGKALGEGTFGKVKLGTHILTGEKVAVKVLEKSRIKDKKDVERISREIKILKQLHHPNVVQIYEIIETEKDLYLVMEFVQGGELFDLIVQNQRLKEKQACKYFQELISGIAYIHQLGICHRDLKPENLLVDYDQSLKIVDFGLSNLYEQGTMLKTACGSPCYAAPEMIAGQRYDGLLSDLWSCGVVLYAMLCGYLPYEDQKTSDLYKKILNAEYNLPDFLSEEAKDMISKIFNTDPNKRINIEQIRKHPWYQIHKPETPSFHVCPPNIQMQRSDVITKQGKQYKILQRPNLLNQKIVQNLEAQQGFNRESLLKSIKNNKHNHLTATYYLLLKKHMIRHLKPYSDAFMELKQVEEAATFQDNNQKPIIQLKSQQVSQALLKNKEVVGMETSEVKIKTEKEVQKQFQSIDHNVIMNSTENCTSIEKNDPKKSFQPQDDRNPSKFNEEFQPQTNQQFVAKKGIGASKQAQNAFHHRREQSANPYIGSTPATQEDHQNLKQYQNQLDQLNKKEQQIRNSRWKNNNNAEISQNNSQTNLSSRRGQKSKQKSQDSFKNVLIDENHPSVNPHVINHYQVKKRAESYNKQRNNESLDQLDQIMNEGIEDGQVEFEYIQSKNMKHSQKGHHREVRAPSSGSSGSQPRVQVSGGSKDATSTASHHSNNSSGAQRRYDSIEHQRQSQIDKFLQSPQEQIANLMNKKKGPEQYYKKQINSNSKKESYPQNPQNDKINLVNVLKKEQLTKKRNSSKVSAQLTEEVQDDKGGPQATSQYYKQLQQQLAMLNQRRTEEYQNLKESYQDSQGEFSELDARRNDSNKTYVNEKSSLLVKQQLSIQPSNFTVSQPNSVKQGHRKAKSMLNQNGQNEAYQNQKVQQIKLSDGSIRHLIQQLSTNPQQTNQKGVKEQPVGTAPTMPQAPKSGNVLKLKQQVIKSNKSRDRGERGGSRGDRGERQSSQTISGSQNTQTIKKKQTILHTTKNTAGQTHQNNFDIVDAVKQGQATHQQSVQHATQGTGARKSGITLTSNYSKATKPAPDGQSDGYLQNLLREYEKNNTNKSNNSIPSQVQILSQQYDQKNTENKRSNIKIQKIQKQSIKPSSNQVENIHKNISQNQKALQSMTQNLFQKNNGGQLIANPPRHTTDYTDDKSSINFNDSLRGSARGFVSNTNPPSATQNQANRRYSQNPTGAAQTSGQSSIVNPRQSSHQKTNSSASNNNVRTSHISGINHFQTQDNRGNRGSSNTVSKSGPNPAEEKSRMKQHPASTTAATSTAKQQPGAYLDNVAANSAMNAAIDAMGGMDEVLGKIQAQMELVSGHGSTKAQQRVSSSKSKGPVVQQSRGSESRVAEPSKTTQMSIMSKYNQQQQRNPQQPGTRHYSAPREASYAQVLDEDEQKRQHLLNQSVDMSQINNIQAQIKNLNGGFKQYEEIHKINLSQFGSNPRTSQNQRQPNGTAANGNGLMSMINQQAYKQSTEVMLVKQSQVNQTPNTSSHQRKKSNFDFNSTQYTAGAAGRTTSQTAITQATQKPYGQSDNSSRGQSNVIMGNVNLTVQMNHIY